jgi:hypothetical protein
MWRVEPRKLQTSILRLRFDRAAIEAQSKDAGGGEAY